MTRRCATRVILERKLRGATLLQVAPRSDRFLVALIGETRRGRYLALADGVGEHELLSAAINVYELETFDEMNDLNDYHYGGEWHLVNETDYAATGLVESYNNTSGFLHRMKNQRENPIRVSNDISYMTALLDDELSLIKHGKPIPIPWSKQTEHLKGLESLRHDFVGCLGVLANVFKNDLSRALYGDEENAILRRLLWGMGYLEKYHPVYARPQLKEVLERLFKNDSPTLSDLPEADWRLISREIPLVSQDLNQIKNRIEVIPLD